METSTITVRVERDLTRLDVLRIMRAYFRANAHRDRISKSEFYRYLRANFILVDPITLGEPISTRDAEISHLAESNSDRLFPSLRKSSGVINS